MSKNWKFGNIGNGVTLALAVAEGAVAGDVVPIGSGGLMGYMVTERGTSDGPNAAGVKSGYASVRLLPAQGVIELEVDGASPGDPVFGSVDGVTGAVTYSTDNSLTSYHVGHVVEPQDQTPTGSGNVFVYLGSAGTIAPAAP